MEGAGGMSPKKDWQQLVKQGLFEEAVFTEQMKGQVLDAIGTGQRYRSKAFLGKRLARVSLAAAAACIVAGGIWLFGSPYAGLQEWAGEIKQAAGLQGDEGNTGQGQSGIKLPAASSQPNEDERWKRELAVDYKPLDAPIWKKGDISRSTDPDILPGLSNKFSPLQSASSVEVVQLTDIELLDSKELEGFGTLLHYNLVNDDELKYGTNEKMDYFGFVAKETSEPGTLYHFGLGHMYERGEPAVTHVFGDPALKIEQEQCRIDQEDCSFYFIYGEEGVKSSLTISAKTFERDLDGDGLEEIIATTFKQNQIYLFKEKNGLLEWASIREIVGAKPDEQVAYNERDGTFSLTTPGDDLAPIRYFSFKEGESKLVMVRE
jgi:hypothetical protein